MSPSLLFVQPITNLVWNRAPGDVLQPEVRPFTFSSQTGKTVDTVTFILIRPITAKIRTTTILGDPGAVTRVERKGTTKVFKHRPKTPGHWLSPDHFQTFKRMLAPDWTQKMLCIIAPNRQTVSREFFSWVRMRRLFSRRSCPVRSPSFPNQKWRKYRWVDKRFGCYQQEQFNLHWETFVSDGSQCIVNNRKFNMQRRRESKKKKQ